MIVFILVAVALLCILLKPNYKEPVVIPKVFTPEQCDHIIKTAGSKLEPSVMDTDYHIDKKIRDSETAWIDPKENSVAKKMIKKCVSFTDRKPINSEQLQVLKYKEGGFYTPHQDAFYDEENPRTVTAIIALNDDYEGGHTYFKDGTSLAPVVGRAIFFDGTYYSHGVTPIDKNDRYTIAAWMKKNDISEHSTKP